ncbi:autotransporter outer membrane beta-barrel domain-containing protein [Lysobacter enzymogenes]|nr:autotransporter outer membrane beta-barrel domain-containing protein [Lysobacter enzymogenes]QCW27984.1 autotransporter outer membrane beta-barrel domain-containing protein [Lysobacter enzymogenes]
MRQNGGGATDSVVVAGNAAINGGQVVAIPQAGSYAPVTDYRILDASSLSGAFTGVSQTALPFLDAALFVQGNDVFLRLSEHDAGGTGIRFNQFPGLSANQQAVANALQAIADRNSGQLPTLIAAARGLSAAQAPRAFDTLNGETYASIASAQRYNAEQLQRSVARQLDLARDNGVDEESTLGTLWATAYGGRAEFDGERLAGIDNTVGGLAIGLEGSPGAHFRFGGHIGMAHSKMETDRRDDKVDGDLFNVGIHWLYAPGAFWTQGAAGYSYGSFDAEREIAVGVYNRRTQAHFSNDGAYAMLEAGWRWDGASVRIEPLLGVYYNKVESVSFRERGAGDADLLVSVASYDTTTAGVGVRFSGAPGNGARKWSPTADIRYLHDLQDDRPYARNAFAGASVPGFATTGFAAERNRWNVGLGLQYRMGPASSGFLEYRGDLGSDDRAHSLNLGLRLGWGATPAMAAARARRWRRRRRPGGRRRRVRAGRRGDGFGVGVEFEFECVDEGGERGGAAAAGAAAAADPAAASAPGAGSGSVRRAARPPWGRAAGGRGGDGRLNAAGSNTAGSSAASTNAASATSSDPSRAGALAAAGGGAVAAGADAKVGSGSAGFGQCKLRPAAKAAPARPLAKAKHGGARPLSKSKRVASRGTGSKAKPRRPATRLAAATPRSVPPSGAVTQPTTWCDEASARTP